MPAGELRIIRRRIKSVQSTMKITKAMELIATSRILKAEQRVAASRPYAVRMATVLGNLASAVGGDVQHPLLERRENVESSAVLVIAGDRGLCGGYNTNVLRLAERTLEAMPGRTKSVITVGRKGQAYFTYRNVPVLASYTGMSDQPTYAQAKEVADFVIDAFTSGSIDLVELVSTQFVSAAKQVVRAGPLLPIDTGTIGEIDEKVGRSGAADAQAAAAGAQVVAPDTVFEPDPTAILGDLMPRGVQSRVYSAMLDACASEHAERRRAMKSATDNAQDLIRLLNIQANKARQASITTEILEIVGGAEALAASKEEADV